MKTGVRVAVVVAGVVGLAVALLAGRMALMAGRLDAAYATVTPVDLSRVADGEYVAEFGDFLVRAEVAVTVRGGRITAVTVVRQDCGPGYEAEDIPSRIVAAQSPRVDVVSGATGSSKSIMVAAHRALAGR